MHSVQHRCTSNVKPFFIVRRSELSYSFQQGCTFQHTFFYPMFLAVWAALEQRWKPLKWQHDRNTPQVNNLGFKKIYIFPSFSDCKNSWNEKNPASCLEKRSPWVFDRVIAAAKIFSWPFVVPVFPLVSLDWLQYLWHELKEEADGRALLQRLPVPQPGSCGTGSFILHHRGTWQCGDLCGLQMRGHSSPKNELRNTSPINLFSLALLGRWPNPKPSVRIFFK